MRFKIFKFKQVKSTNDTAIRIIKKTNLNCGIVYSELQNAGRGQYGKKWISQKGNLFISFFYNLENFNISLKRLTILNSSFVKKFLSKYYKKKIIFKKPNDLVIEKKKICGILQETINKLNNSYLIVGIGINLVKNPYIKNYNTTNLYDLTKKKLSKKIALNELKEIFEINLNKVNRGKKIIK
tara:strand:+ start:408 stop:956 length:549 start_codon:yes stop_codon:yes gene_type:complete